MSLFVIYFGTNRDWPELHHHNIMFGPRYRELLSDIFDRGHLADDFSLYLHAPSKSDPTLAPAGHHAFYVLAPVPHLGLAPLDWEAMGEAYADRIVTYLEERYMPGLRQSIVTQRLRTPLDFQNQLAAPFGSAFSLEPRLTQSAWFRVHNRDPRIARLYFVGAGTHPGAGIPGVVGSAKATALVIAQDQPQSLQQYTHEAIAYGSQSFAFASRLLGAQQRQGITALYAWCRYCDDQIDRLPADASLVAKQEVLASLREQTLAAYEGRTSHAAFGLFADVVARYQIPQQYPLALLEGMAMDVQGDTYATFSDLRQYCHRVAGVVGIMFSYIVGVSHAQALAHADHLGIAMQLTNIARDVKTDYELGRLYLPQSWLAAEGVDPAKLFAPEQRAALGAVVDKLLAEADTYYQSGLQGLVYLPAQAAVAVHAAAQIYRDIGEQVRAAGSAGLERRQWTSKRRKIWLACRSVPKTLFILARRWRTPWQRAALPAALNEATPASKLAT